TAGHCHFMTLSALVSTFGGIVTPICLAVFRLMMNSNFFGCSTGRSAGLVSPLQDSVHVICYAPVALRFVRPVGHEPPAATNSLTEEIDGKRVFNAKSTIRFRLVFVSGLPSTKSPSGRCLPIPENTLSKSTAPRTSQDQTVKPRPHAAAG